MATILPSGEEMSVTPNEVLKYLNPDGLRQLLRQERLRWLLKPNKDANYYDNTRLFKFSGELHNEALYQRMEIRTFPDNGAYSGFAGVNVDSGLYGLTHNFDKWPNTMSTQSRGKVVNRVTIGATAKIPNLIGTGIDDEGFISDHTNNRTAALTFDPYDGRIYAMTNDESVYINNDHRSNPIPGRAVARIIDVPTRITQLTNDLGFISDQKYTHTDNNFTHSNRFVVDNMDDRTFVYPSIAKDKSGNLIKNIKMNMDGSISYHPGIFASLAELESVDIINQLTPLRNNAESADGNRPNNYYLMDGVWGDDPKTSDPQNPSNMEQSMLGVQPVPYKTKGTRYQWRYNRIDTYYYADDIGINIVMSGEKYKIGDILSYTFGDDSFQFEVTAVGANGEIQSGNYVKGTTKFFTDDPSTHGRGVTFANMNGEGHNATLSISSIATLETYATQIKNNLYAYVNISPTVQSENDSPWSDIHAPDIQGGVIGTRSNNMIGYTGVNSGRGGYEGNPNTDALSLYEHGGNSTAGDTIHLYRYVINTTNPTWDIVDGVRVYTGKWVDQGPMAIQNPADIKALYLSNPDTNNFNNYYKFMMDIMVDLFNKNPDAIISNNPNAVSSMYIHKDEVDPAEDKRFTTKKIDNVTGQIVEVDITDKVLYINVATGLAFVYNSGFKNDPSFKYGTRGPGWIPIAGATTR